MQSDEQELELMDNSLNPQPHKFGMPWYAVLGILCLSLIVFLFPGCKIVGLLLCPAALGFGWWLCRHDPKEPQLIFHDLCLPSEFDPGK